MGVSTRLPALRARVPAPMLRALELSAERSGTSLSGAVRELLVIALADRGLWPPPAGEARRGR